MDAPPVQYVKTSDGYDIAYTESGAGTPLVFMPYGFTHVQNAWQGPWIAPLFRWLSQRFHFVHYDGRGQGLSQRGLPEEISIESFSHDLRAVLEKLDFDRPVLFADGRWAHVAVHFARDNPGRVAALILARTSVGAGPDGSWMVSAAANDWDAFLRIEFPDSVPPRIRDQAIERMKAAVNQADFIRIGKVFAQSDLSEWLLTLMVPVLVIHPRDTLSPWLKQEQAAQVAALIPNGRLMVLNGYGTMWGDLDEVTAAIEGFLDGLPGETGHSMAVADDLANLSSRELEVLRLVALGKTNHEIADELVISPNTVAKHVTNILTKLNAANRVEATTYAHRHKLV